MSINTYLVDTFHIYAASALAANTVLRSILGGVFPLFGLQMYDGLGLGKLPTLPTSLLPTSAMQLDTCWFLILTLTMLMMMMLMMMHVGWGNSLLAFVALAMCPIPWVFYHYGERIRTHPKWQVQF